MEPFNQGDRPPDAEENRRSRYGQRLGGKARPLAHSKYIPTSVGPLTLQKLVQLLKGEGARDRIILILHECIWNAPVVSLVLPAFEDTGSLGSPLRH